MTDAPRTLDALRKINDPEEAVRYALAYIEHGENQIAAARIERDKALGALVEKHGPAKVRKMFEPKLSLSTVKNAHRTYRATKRK
jgi:hypothetical protein